MTVRSRFGSLLLFTALATPAAATAQQGIIRGVVRDSLGAPIKDADVGILARHVVARTNGDGRFILRRLPVGEYEISARRLGYQPMRTTVRVVETGMDSVRIVLHARPVQLEGVESSERAISQLRNIEDFHRRRLQGLGQYVTREDFPQVSSVADMLRIIPGLRFVNIGAGQWGIRLPATNLYEQHCEPTIWVDGQTARDIEIDDIPVTDIEGIEVYSGPSTTPQRFAPSVSRGSCGTIVVWTRPPQPKPRPTKKP